MKCPKCGIHYDDGDKECPMCGTAKPLFAKDNSKLAKTTATLAKPSKAAQEDLKEFYNPDLKDAEKREKKRTGSMGSILDLGSNDNKGSFPSSKKKNNGKDAGIVVIIIFVIFVLVNIIPIIFGAINTAVSSLGEAVTVIDVSEPEPDIEYIPYGGMWSADDDMVFSIVPDDTEFYYPCYTVSIGNYTELGGYYAENANIYDWSEVWDTLNMDEYNAWTVTLFPEEAANTDAIGMTEDDFYDYQESYVMLAICSPKDNPDEVFLYNVYGVPWLEEGEMLPITQIMDGEEYAKMLSESEQ